MRIARYTPRIADFFNVIPSDLGRPLHHITNRLDYPRLAEDAATVFDTLQPLEREVRDAEGRDYIVRVHPYRTQEDRIDGAVMTFFDITGHRAAETALRASEEHFRLFVTASSDTLYRMNADWTELRNLDGMAFLADTAAPSSGWLEKYIPHADQPELQAAFARAIADKAIFRMEHRVIRADGAIAWVFSRAVPLLDRDGNIVEWFGAAIDITRREQVDEARRASDARLAAVFEGLPVGVAVVDGSGTVILSNGAMRRYLPNGVIPSRDLARVDRWRAWHADGRRLTPDEFPGARALRGERVMPGLDMRYRGDDEVDMWTRVAAVPIVDENGQGTDTFAVVIDAAPARAMPGE
jgi:two-component system CheB/CheR fusion protein